MDIDGTLSRWLDRAASGIRFRPDRAAVRRELLDHIDDKIAGLQRSFPDIPPQEARDRALAAMGDVDELSAALARVHRPWLGWLWYACRGVLILSAVVWLLWTALPSLMEGDNDAEWKRHHQEFRYVGTEQGEWAPPPDVQVGGYTLEVTRAARSQETYTDGGGCGQVRWRCESAYMTLRLTARLPWERPAPLNNSLKEHMTARDSAGRTYSFDAVYGGGHADWDDQPFEDGKSGLNWREYELYLRDITPGAEWIELRYDFGGRRFTIRADIPEEIHYFSGKIWPEEEEGAV